MHSTSISYLPKSSHGYPSQVRATSLPRSTQSERHPSQVRATSLPSPSDIPPKSERHPSPGLLDRSPISSQAPPKSERHPFPGLLDRSPISSQVYPIGQTFSLYLLSSSSLAESGRDMIRRSGVFTAIDFLVLPAVRTMPVGTRHISSLFT